MFAPPPSGTVAEYVVFFSDRFSQWHLSLHSSMICSDFHTILMVFTPPSRWYILLTGWKWEMVEFTLSQLDMGNTSLWIIDRKSSVLYRPEDPSISMILDNPAGFGQSCWSCTGHMQDGCPNIKQHPVPSECHPSFAIYICLCTPSEWWDTILLTSMTLYLA